MRRAITLVAIRTLVLLVLTASAALLYDYTRPLPAFCEAGAGCDAVRSSSFAYILGIPQPAIGLLAYLVVFSITLLDHERRRKYLFPVTAAGGVLGLVFLLIQAFVIHRFCTLCVLVDVASALAAVFAWFHRRAEGHDGAVPRFGWSAFAALAVVVPLLFGAASPKPSVPGGVARFWVPGKVTIVEMSDFECPYCRILHPTLAETVEPYGDKVQLVRLSVPLRSHPNARVAAIAYACAKKLGKGEEIAHLLFASKNLTEQGCRASARQVGLDAAAFDACFDGSEGETLMRSDVELAQTIKFRGLPTLWIGTENLIGAVGAEELRSVIDAQIAGPSPTKRSLPQGWMWLILGGAFSALAAFSLLRKPR